MNVMLLLAKKELNTITFNIISYKHLKKKHSSFFLIIFIDFVFKLCWIFIF